MIKSAFIILCCAVIFSLNMANGAAPIPVPYAKDKARAYLKHYDKNHNGVIDEDEKEAIRKDYAADPNGDLKHFDKNGDGKLDDEEITAIKPPTGNGKKKAEKSEKTETADKAGKGDKADAAAKVEKTEKPADSAAKSDQTAKPKETEKGPKPDK